MTVRLYQSTDASAPALSGSAGALCTVLDAVLVNGYGSKTAAGWTIAYTATSKRQYAMAAGGTGCQLYVDDTGPGTGAAKEARFCGFKTGTAIGTGTGQFPTSAQSTIGIGMLAIRKSTTADATARAWTIIADGQTIYLFIESGDFTAPLMVTSTAFGDFFSYSSTDTNNALIIGRTTENSGNAATIGNYRQDLVTYLEPFSGLSAPFNMNAGAQLANTVLLSAPLAGHFTAGSYTNVGSALAFGKHTDYAKMGLPGISTSLGLQLGYQGYWTAGSSQTGTVWLGGLLYPNAPDNGLYLAPVWIHHGGIVRGYLKGLWAPVQNCPLGHGSTYSGTGNLTGKSMISQALLALRDVTSASTVHTPAEVHIEYSNTWS